LKQLPITGAKPKNKNFTIKLLKSKVFVCWYWFACQDNDPNKLKTDSLYRDFNKGILNSNYEHYMPLLIK